MRASSESPASSASSPRRRQTSSLPSDEAERCSASSAYSARARDRWRVRYDEIGERVERGDVLGVGGERGLVVAGGGGDVVELALARRPASKRRSARSAGSSTAAARARNSCASAGPVAARCQDVLALHERLGVVGRARQDLLAARVDLGQVADARGERRAGAATARGAVSPSGSTASRSSMRRRSSSGSPSSSAQAQQAVVGLAAGFAADGRRLGEPLARALVIAGALVQLAGALQRLGALGRAAGRQRRRQPLGGERGVAPALRVLIEAHQIGPRRHVGGRGGVERQLGRLLEVAQRRGAVEQLVLEQLRQLDVQPRALERVGGQRQLAIALLGGERPLAARLGHLAQRARRFAQVGIAGDGLLEGAIGVEVALELRLEQRAPAAAPAARARADRR